MTFDRLGCHPRAVEVMSEQEPSAAVWLLAAALAKYRAWAEAQKRDGPGYEQWPDIFWHPKHRLPVAPFVGRMHKHHSKENSAELAALDAETLGRWLDYARRRLKVVERYGFCVYLVGLIQGPDGPEGLMKVWESRA